LSGVDRAWSCTFVHGVSVGFLRGDAMASVDKLNAATSDGVKVLRREATALKEIVAERRVSIACRRRHE
jgi:hypothetical protein